MEAPTLNESGEEFGDLLSKRQRADPDLREIMVYLETGDLPSDDKRARELVLGKFQFTLCDHALYRVEDDKSLRIVPPTTDRRKIFMRVLLLDTSVKTKYIVH